MKYKSICPRPINVCTKQRIMDEVFEEEPNQELENLVNNNYIVEIGEKKIETDKKPKKAKNKKRKEDVESKENVEPIDEIQRNMSFE